MTLYAVLNETSDTILSTGTARELWPDVSFPASGPREDWLAARNAQEVREFRTYNTETERLVRVDPYLDNGLVYRVEVQPRPPATPPPQWENFVDTVSDATQWESIIAAIAATKPAAAQVFAGSLATLVYGDYALFLRLFRKAANRGYITAQQVTAVRAVATANDLPAEFIRLLDPAEAP